MPEKGTRKGKACEYSCARVKLILRREYSYYLIQLYIPCIMLVVVSWVSFWLDKDAVPARVSLGVTTLLTMTTQASGINSKLPPVSYIKAVDVWIGICLGFIFSALLEYALVNYYGRKEFTRRERGKKLGGLQQMAAQLPSLMGPDCLCPPSIVPNAHMNMMHDTINMNLSGLNNNDVHPLRQHRRSMRLDLSVLNSQMPLRTKLRKMLGDDLSKRVDIVSRYMFPALFISFLSKLLPAAVI
ncbi:unnamed protein product [Bursaphelenchus xylophilus]|uniref:(pine wood nematode) hypothetical protein n=1 Tax=Bursaphelenchus xylophilus TaxID=6326 RepID=A0A7I8XF48_BURXY|nr:unnamed protein product [Bursaphelenchus xylophilus]CAG9113354.1 unnamed protein product [Bursaphelenchus xylophilus]